MPEIPLYRKTVAPITQVPAAEASAAAAAGPWKAIAELGGTVKQVAQMGQQYIARKEELKASSDMADYKIRKKQLETNLIQKKNDAIMSGVPYYQIYSEVVEPELKRFEEEHGNRNYSKKSENIIRAQWGLDSQIIAAREVSEREKMELEDYTLRLGQEAELLLGDGDNEGADAIYNQLEGIVGEGRVNQMKSGALYNMHDLDLIASEREWLETRDDNAYFQNLEDIQKRANDSPMLENHKRQITRVASSKMNNFMKKRVNSFEKAKNRFVELSISGDITTQDYEELKREAGIPYAEAMEKVAIATLEAKAATDSDAKEAIGWLNKMKTGESNWPETLRKTQKYGNGIGELCVIVAGNIAADLSKTQNAVVGYEFLYRNKKFKVGGFTSDFIGRINDYANLMEDGQASFVNDKLKAIANWQQMNPSPSEDDYKVFVSEQFKKVAEVEVQKMNSPQFQIPAQVPSISMQEEYDALPSGSQYIHPDGSTRIKQ